MENWKDPSTARNWSFDPTQHNPARAEQLDILLTLLQDHYRPGSTIIDIGMGSGLVEEMIFKRIPEARILGIDSSPAMLELAQERLQSYRDSYKVLVHDLREIGSLRLPQRDYGVIISVQTIHNVEDRFKPPILRFAYDTLQAGGLFLQLDRVSVDTPALFACYLSLWDRLDNLYGAHIREGRTFEGHTESVRARGDHPASLEQNLAWLREVGFEAACLHSHANRTLIAAVRP